MKDKVIDAKEKMLNFLKQDYGKKIVLLSIGAILLIMLISGTINSIIPKGTAYKINDLIWERQINIEKYALVHDNGWELPENARLIEKKRELFKIDIVDEEEMHIKSTNKPVEVGKDEKGMPIYELKPVTEEYVIPKQREVEVYEMRYYYEIEKWYINDKIKTSGKNDEPKWGEYYLKNDERVGEEKETYWFTYTDEQGKEKSAKVQYEDWQKLKQGQRVYGEINPFGKFIPNK